MITYRTFSWELMTPREREQITKDLAAHRVNPADVPIEVEIGWDDVHDEYVIPTYVRPFQLDDWTGKLPIRKLRRRRLHSLGEWHPQARGNRVWIDNLEITQYLTGPPVLEAGHAYRISTRPQDWATPAREILRARGAWHA